MSKTHPAVALFTEVLDRFEEAAIDHYRAILVRGAQPGGTSEKARRDEKRETLIRAFEDLVTSSTIPAPTLPDTLEGHWSTPEGKEMAERYSRKDRKDLGFGDKTDLEIANAIFLIDRNSLDLISLQTAAKERIRWLSVQLAIAKGIVKTEPYWRTLSQRDQQLLLELEENMIRDDVSSIAEGRLNQATREEIEQALEGLRDEDEN